MISKPISESNQVPLLQPMLTQSDARIRQLEQELDQTRRQLAEKLREVQALRQHKTVFLANLSHELRTPLNSIMVFSQILHENSDGRLTSRQVEFAQAIHIAGNQLLRVIEAVLDFSTLEAGAVTLHAETIHLANIAAYLDQNFRPLAERQGLTFSITCDQQLPEQIVTDRQRLEEIVKQLVSNALKFTPTGQIQVQITRPSAAAPLTGNMTPQSAVAIAVTDTGIGIPPSQHAMIFDAFFQVEGTLARKYEGLGLGLAIAHSLADLLGGTIQVESAVGQGSTFTLYLPETLQGQIPDQVAMAPAYFTVASNVEVIRDDRREITPTDQVLIIIENEPTCAKRLFDRAHERGLKCVLAGDGEAGLLLVHQYHPSAIVLSLELPGVEGQMVLERLKTDLAVRHVPVIIVSDQAQARDILKIGALSIQQKPLTEAALNDIFDTLAPFVQHGSQTVAVASADAARQRQICELLSDQHGQLLTASTLPQLLQILDTEHVDCLVVDAATQTLPLAEVVESLPHHITHCRVLPVILYAEAASQISLPSDAPWPVLLRTVYTPAHLVADATLVLHRDMADLPPAQQKLLHKLYDKESAMRGKTILLIDDDMRAAFGLSNLLEEHGLEMKLVENGSAALEIADTSAAIDLILLATHLPDMEGGTLLYRLRKWPAYAHVPIVMLSQTAQRGERNHYLQLGANEYLSKPIQPEKLLSVLRVWLG